jgi:sporulation protein YlmC with PRC-barrel domain
MKTHVSLAALLLSAALVVPATAQTTGAPTTTPNSTMPGQQPMGATGAAQQGARAAMQAVAAPQPGQMLGSDLTGTNVYGMNNETIGDINDVLIGRDGRVVAVVVGVGGFLGIGQKDVAVPFEALEIQSAATTGNRTTGTGTTTGTGVTGTGTTGMTGTGSTGTTGTATTGTGTTGMTAQGQQGTLNPDRIVLRGMTRADLESAPAFDADGTRTGGTTGSTGMTGSGTGTSNPSGTTTTPPRP